MKIIDTTTYFEEDLMMDLRFNILDPFIDKFIVCEARFSHSGKKKEIKFDKKNFPKFEDKIIHAIVDNEPANLIIKNKIVNGFKDAVSQDSKKTINNTLNTMPQIKSVLSKKFLKKLKIPKRNKSNPITPISIKRVK